LPFREHLASTATGNLEQCFNAGLKKQEQKPMKYLMILEKGATSYGTHVPDLPGCVAVGNTKDEVMTLIREAIEFHIDGLR
jgi:hypothetical protein